MLDYVFFDRRPCERFLGYVRERGVAAVLREGEESLEVSLPEDLDEAVGEEIEAYYDQMMALDQELFDAGAAAGAGDYDAAGVVVNLRDGRTVYAEVEPRLLGRVMEVLAPEEFGRLVDAIVDAVERPDERGLCQRRREGS